MKKLILLAFLAAIPCLAQSAPPTTLLPGTVGNTGGLALLGGYSVTTTGSTYTLVPNEWWHQGLNIAGTATTIVAPKNIGQAYDVTNSESGSITFGGSTGTTVTIAAGATVRVKCSDGANYVQVGSLTQAQFNTFLINPGPIGGGTANAGTFSIMDAANVGITTTFALDYLTPSSAPLCNLGGSPGVTNVGCSGGGSGGLSGQTAGYAVEAATATTATGPFPMDDSITTANTITAHKAFAVNDGSGHGGGINGTEGTAPTGVSGVDQLWADSGSHRWKMNLNNAGPLYPVGITTPGAVNDCLKMAANGIDAVDAGITCAGGISVKIKFVSQLGCAAQNTDLNIGGGTDDTACINAALAGATATSPVLVWQDGDSLIGSTPGVGIVGPTGGNWAITGNGGAIARTTITNCTISGGVAIFTTLPNTLVAGQWGTTANLQHCPSITNKTVQILSSGLTSTQFEVTASGSVSSGAESYATFNRVEGAGFFLASAANIDAIANGNFLAGGGAYCGINNTTAGSQHAQGANIRLSNFVLNGNANGQTNYCFGEHIVDINGFDMEGVIDYNSSHFSLTLDNASDWVVDKDTFFSSADPTGTNTDGVHVDGPSKGGRITNSYFHTGDDSIALNAWEGYCGPIEGTQIANDYADYSFDFIRAYTTDASVCPSNSNIPSVNKTSITAFNGTTPNYMGILGLGGGGSSTTGTYTKAITDFKWENSTIEILPGGSASAVAPLEIYDNVTDLTLSHVNIIGMQSPYIVQLQASTLVSNWGRFNFNDVNVVDNSTGNAFQSLIESDVGAGNTLSAIDANGFTVRGRGVTPLAVSCLYCMTGAAITAALDYVGGSNIDPTNITGLLGGSGSPNSLIFNVDSPLGFVTNGPTFSSTTPLTLAAGSQAFSSLYKGNETIVQRAGGGPYTFTLPPWQVGIKKCVQNSNGAISGLKVLAQGTTPIVDSDGNQSAAGGYIQSSGSAADSICLIGDPQSNVWQVTSAIGLWTLDGGSVTSGNVHRLIAGTNVTLSPPSGLGNVTINASGGGGGISGSGTTGTFPLFTGSTAIGNSGVTEIGSASTTSNALSLTSSGGSLPTNLASVVGVQSYMSLNAIYSAPNWTYQTTGPIGAFRFQEDGSQTAFDLALGQNSSGNWSNIDTTSVAEWCQSGTSSTNQCWINPAVSAPTFPTNAAFVVNPSANWYVDFSGNQRQASGTVLGWNGDTGISRDSAGVFDFGNGTPSNSAGSILATGGTFVQISSGNINAATFNTSSNCTAIVSPAVCSTAAAGSVVIPTGTTSSTLTVNTTAVKSTSQIFFYPDDSLGTRLGVTCNSTLATLAGGSFISARTPGTSFAITFNGSILTNGVCGSYFIIN